MNTPTVEPGAGESAHFPSYRDLPPADGGFRSGWSVFGADDELGTINHLTPERRVAAARLVQTGVTINLDHPLDLDLGLFKHRAPYEHHIFEILPRILDERLDNFCPQNSSQWDGFRHVGALPGFYNDGISYEDAMRPGGRLGIDRIALAGIFGRGVLLDIASHLSSQGHPLSPTARAEIPTSVLDEVAEAQGVKVQPGDILLLRFGVDSFLKAQVRGETTDRFAYSCPGLLPEESSLEWLWDNQVAAVVADNIAVETTPPRTLEARLHYPMIGLLGLTLGELFDLEILAQACSSQGRYDFLFTAKPLMVTGGLGSPANAMAIF